MYINSRYGMIANSFGMPETQTCYHKNRVQTLKQLINFGQLKGLLAASFGSKRGRSGGGQPFTREHQRVATHFAGDAESQYGPADEQLDKSQRIPYQRVDVERYLQKTREPHRQVGIEAEEEGNQNLCVLPFLEILAQEQHLYGDEKYMHADGQLAHGEIDTRHQRQNIRRSRDGR